jgi:butyryl-CoA dehydrogenase
MDLQLTAEQKLIQETARELAAKEINPIAAEIDETGRFPREVVARMAEAGMFGILIPPPFGGAGGNGLDLALITEEIAASSASIAWSFVTSTCAAFIILAFGNDEQRKKYLPALARGEKLGAVAFVEPSGGTNWQMTMRTRAAVEGNEYVINGSKCFITNAGEADIYIIGVRTDPTKGPMGVSALIVERDTPGFSFGAREDKLGLRADPTGELVFGDCRVPKGNLVGQEGDAMKNFQAMGALDCAGQAVTFVGIARAALEASVKYTKERIVVEPRTLAHFENVQRAIADMTVAVEAARLTAYRASLHLGEGPDPLIPLAAMFAKDVALDVTDKAVELHGGYGCTVDFPVERYLRDAKTLSLQKTADYVRATVGKMLLGVPMGPPPGAGGPPRS